jgi:hypothetical protein
MAKDPKRREQAFAVLRVDDFLNAECLEHRVSVKEVVRSLQIAEREVTRLNELNRNKGCRYFWQSTRLFPPGESFGTHEAAEDDL